MKASIEAATAKAERERKGEGDDDLCDQCYKKRFACHFKRFNLVIYFEYQIKLIHFAGKNVNGN